MNHTAEHSEKRTLDPASLDHQSVYKIMAGCIVPRPIGFIATIGTNGIFNAAPFSFFNMVSHIPPLVSVSIARNSAGDGPKDTLANIASGGEFVVNVVDDAIVAAVDKCSESYPADVDEIAVSGLTPVKSSSVKPPCISEAPVNFECRLVQLVNLDGSIHTLVIGRVVRMHVRADLLTANLRIDQGKLAAVGRMAGNTYCRTSDLFTLAHDGFAVIDAHSVGNVRGG